MVPQPSTESVDSRPLTRRRCLQAGIAAVSLAGVPAVGAQSTPEPPGVVQRRTYENLPVTATADAHGEGRILVGRAGGSYPTADDPVRVALTDASGAVRQRASFTPELPDDAHALPDVLRTEDGYAVAAGPWLARLDTDLAVRTVSGNVEEMGASRLTRLVPLPDGFVAGFTEWLPNAFWTWIVGFDAEGRYRWHHEVNTNASQELNFLLPAGDGVVAGGTFPWFIEFDADGSSRRIDIPDDRPDGVLNAGIRDGDGVILCSGSAAARLDADYELDWTREYAALGERYVSGVMPTDDGGFVFRTTPGESGDFTLAKANADGELQWHHAYGVDTRRHVTEPRTMHQLPSGEYLIAGGANTSTEGWVLTLSEAATPTPAPTATATRTATETPAGRSPVPTTADGDRETTTTAPGFGVVAAGAALAGTLAAALRRSRG